MRTLEQELKSVEAWACCSEPERRVRAEHELREMKSLFSRLLEELDEYDRDDGNAPGHCHEVPGVWDSDNGKKAGKPCAWCAIWAKAKAMGLTHNANVCGLPHGKDSK
jgi:hypothetical protein